MQVTYQDLLVAEQEPVEHGGELLDPGQVESDVEAVLAGDPEAFGDLGERRRPQRLGRRVPGVPEARS